MSIFAQYRSKRNENIKKRRSTSRDCSFFFFFLSNGFLNYSIFKWILRPSDCLFFPFIVLSISKRPTVADRLTFADHVREIILCYNYMYNIVAAYNTWLTTRIPHDLTVRVATIAVFKQFSTFQ